MENFIGKMEHFDPNRALAPFLRKLADDLEKNKLSDEEIHRIGEFYMSCVFNTNADKQAEEEMTDKDFVKFFTMGWYVYRQILKGETV